MRIALALVVLACAACGALTPAPAPAVGTPLTSSQLKFKVMDSVGKPVYCDRDFYPLARQGGEEANAIAQYPVIKADGESYAAIVAHENLPAGDLTDAQKLVLYRAWKLLQAVTLGPAGADYSFSYRVQSNNGNASYLLVSGAVRVDGIVKVSSRTPTGPPICPICLAAGTLISTPHGDVRVTEIERGMLVWTATADGSRVAEPVIEIGSTPVPAGHLMVHLILADGRELLASPGHRTADGRRLGSLARGDSLDGSTVTTWELVPYSGGRTYDLLPAGPTGYYWANGIKLSSTLRI
ncbi:MAG TPA: Hint domain-containing protein [Candidatus Dormibacteraeota bacterium]|nr:Hint domain-containing protein [Candidatus Dormibacteraeota bacterium]